MGLSHSSFFIFSSLLIFKIMPILIKIFPKTNKIYLMNFILSPFLFSIPYYLFFSLSVLFFLFLFQPLPLKDAEVHATIGPVFPEQRIS